MPTVSIRGTELQPRAISATADRDRAEADVPDSDVILLDGCSTDEIRSIVREYENDPSVRLEFNRKNSGNSFKQWNGGAREICADYGVGRLRRRAATGAAGGVLENEPEVVFAYCRCWRIASDGEPNGYADCYLADFESPARWAADFRADEREVCRNHFVRATRFPMPLPSFFGRPYDQLSAAD